MATYDWQRLADFLRGAMADRGMRVQRDLADAARVSPRTVGDLLSGRPRQTMPTVMPAIEAAVGWGPGSARTVLAGGTPDVVVKPATISATVELPPTEASATVSVEEARFLLRLLAERVEQLPVDDRTRIVLEASVEDLARKIREAVTDGNRDTA